MSSERVDPAEGATVERLMESNVRTVSAELPVASLEEFLLGEEIGGAPVVEDDGRLRGIVSKTDIVRHLAEDLDLTTAEALNDVSVGDIMTEDVVTVAIDAPVSKVARTMVEQHVHRVIVVDDERTIRGILTTFDLLKLLT